MRNPNRYTVKSFMHLRDNANHLVGTSYAAIVTSLTKVIDLNVTTVYTYIVLRNRELIIRELN